MDRLVQLTAHIPVRREHAVRYYGYYFLRCPTQVYIFLDRGISYAPWGD